MTSKDVGRLTREILAVANKRAVNEREACARLLESFETVGMTTSEVALLRAAAAGIRARGNP